MKSHSSAVIERSAMTSRSVQKLTGQIEELMGPNNVKLQAFTVKLAWAFASAVLLLAVVGLVLVVAGYAGAIFSPDKQPQATPAAWPRK